MKGKGQYMKKLWELSIKELVAERKKLQRSLYDLKIKNSLKGLKETHKIGEARIKIARINTVLKSKTS